MSPGEDFKSFVENLNVPELDIGLRTGHTDYIDFIKQDEVPHTIMKGVDTHSRPFLVIKAVGKLEDGNNIELFQTFFQRYTKEPQLWMGCGHHGNSLFETCGGMTESHFNALKDLINGKKISIKRFYRNDNYIFEYIKLAEN